MKTLDQLSVDRSEREFAKSQSKREAQREYEYVLKRGNAPLETDAADLERLMAALERTEKNVLADFGTKTTGPENVRSVVKHNENVTAHETAKQVLAEKVAALDKFRRETVDGPERAEREARGKVRASQGKFDAARSLFVDQHPELFSEERSQLGLH